MGRFVCCTPAVARIVGLVPSLQYPYWLHIAAYGVIVELRAKQWGLLNELIAGSNLPFGAKAAPIVAGVPKAVFHLLNPDATGGFRMRLRGHTIIDVETQALLFEELHAHLMVAIAEHAPEHLFVHAGVVEWRGGAILLPGLSFAGKTTLTAELVRAGATYFSDEYALIDTSGLVHPFARDLQMRSPGSTEQRPLPASELGGVHGIHPVSPRAILFAEYKPDSAWSPQPVTPAMAVMEMMRHCPAIRRIPAGAMQMLARVTEGAPAFRSLRGEAAETAALILQQFMW
jgi:hypothetical protein